MVKKQALIVMKLPQELKDNLAELSKSQGLTLSAFIRTVLYKVVDRKLRYKKEKITKENKN